MATFFRRVDGKRLINIEHIVSVVPPDTAKEQGDYLILMSDHTVMSLHEEEAKELLSLLYVVEGEE